MTSSSSTKTHRMECKQLYVKICVEYSFYLPANWSSEYDAWKTNAAMLANDILMFKWFIVITILMQLYLDICQLECELCSEYWTRRDFDVRTDAILCCSSFLMLVLSIFFCATFVQLNKNNMATNTNKWQLLNKIRGEILCKFNSIQMQV